MSKTKGELTIRNKEGLPIQIRGTLPQIMRAITRASINLGIEFDETLEDCKRILQTKEKMEEGKIG